MGSYRYVVADTLTGILLDELPFQVDSFSQELGGGGDLTANLPLGGLGNIDWRSVTVPFKTAIYAIRDDVQVVWGGVINGRDKATDDSKAIIRAETFEAFLSRRRIKTTLTYGSPTDTHTIVAGIIANIQAQTGGDLGITINASSATSGNLQTITYESYARTKVWEEINRLSELDPGFEASITHTRATGTGLFRPVLNLGAPQLNATLTPALAEYPGNVLSYTFPEVGAANAVTGLGKGDGAAKLIYEAVDSLGQIAEGYPLVEDELSIAEEESLARLTTRTQTDLVARLLDYVVPQVTLNGDAPGLPFGSYPLGIPCRLRAVSLYHPPNGDGSPSLDITRRITGWTVKPPSDGGIEEVTLNLATGLGKITPPRDARAFPHWLMQVERRLRNQETRR